MAYEMKEKSGSLFSAADKKQSDKHPDYTGSCKLNGELMSISAWVNESKSGKKYLRLKFDEYKSKSESTYESSSTSTSDLPY